MYQTISRRVLGPLRGLMPLGTRPWLYLHRGHRGQHDACTLCTIRTFVLPFLLAKIVHTVRIILARLAVARRRLVVRDHDDIVVQFATCSRRRLHVRWLRGRAIRARGGIFVRAERMRVLVREAARYETVLGGDIRGLADLRPDPAPGEVLGTRQACTFQFLACRQALRGGRRSSRSFRRHVMQTGQEENQEMLVAGTSTPR